VDPSTFRIAIPPRMSWLCYQFKTYLLTVQVALKGKQVTG
jgi:hypothetical protein